MNRLDIVAALHARLQQLPNSPPVAWLGVGFTPVLGQTYLSPRLSSYTRQQIGEGPDGEVQHDGTYTVTVRSPAPEGESPALAEVMAGLATLFKRAAEVPVGTAGQSLVLLNFSEQPGMVLADWISTPFVVTWTANDP